ncbi:MAG: PAS domain S-box protein, partial [Deltaproteobacteria bacterium]|nr:PAS domain S-box protein [Deltaproteobacteria bacterium]
GWIFGVVAREHEMLHSVHESRAALVGTVKSMGQRGVLWAGLTTFTALIIVFSALKYLVMPLRTLADATKRVARGDYSVRCQVSTPDETGVLAESFNSMVEKLQAAQEQQVHYANSLEREVKWKDAELNDKRSELVATIELLNKEVERRQIIAEALRNSQQQYYDTLEASLAGVFIIEDGIFTYVNTSLAEMMRSTPSDLKGKDPLDFVIDDDKELVSGNMRQCLNGIDISPFTIKCRRTDGTVYYGEVWAKTATWQNKAVIVGTITDVSSLMRKDERLKRQDRQLQESLEEKETLLREIYHRTKNNMLVIISMLDLQLQDIEDEKAKTIFLETENRIRAMALVHEKLYQSQNLSEIDLGSYLQEITESLIAHMALDDNVLLQADTESMAINIDYAVPLGLVINEIVTNSLKHAFPDKKTGVISLTLQKGLYGGIELMVGDNGIGLPEQLSIETTTSFGLQIIRNLVVMQLNGEITVDRNNGTQYMINFKESRKTKRI